MYRYNTHLADIMVIALFLSPEKIYLAEKIPDLLSYHVRKTYNWLLVFGNLQGQLSLQKFWFYIQPTMRTMEILASVANSVNRVCLNYWWISQPPSPKYRTQYLALRWRFQNTIFPIFSNHYKFFQDFWLEAVQMFIELWIIMFISVYLT